MFIVWYIHCMLIMKIVLLVTSNDTRVRLMNKLNKPYNFRCILWLLFKNKCSVCVMFFEMKRSPITFILNHQFYKIHSIIVSANDNEKHDDYTVLYIWCKSNVSPYDINVILHKLLWLIFYVFELTRVEK